MDNLFLVATKNNDTLKIDLTNKIYWCSDKEKVPLEISGIMKEGKI